MTVIRDTAANFETDEFELWEKMYFVVLSKFSDWFTAKDPRKVKILRKQQSWGE